MSYPVGTICIGQNFVNSTWLNGMQCVIVEPIAPRITENFVTGKVTNDPKYLVRFSDGHISYVRHPNLKRKDWYDEEKRAEDRAALNKRAREQVSEVISACLSAIEAGEKV